MTDGFLRQSPLDHLGLEACAQGGRGAAGVALAEAPFRGLVNLRGDANDGAFSAAFESVFGFLLPTEPNTVTREGEVTAFWLGPDEWWLVVPGPDPEAGPTLADRLRRAFGEQFVAVIDVSESRTCLRVAGPAAASVLQKGCPLDFHPRVFAPGTCAQSHMAKATVLFHRLPAEGDADPAFELYALRSFADYLWTWIEDAAREFGVVVVEG